MSKAFDEERAFFEREALRSPSSAPNNSGAPLHAPSCVPTPPLTADDVKNLRDVMTRAPSSSNYRWPEVVKAANNLCDTVATLTAQLAQRLPYPADTGRTHSAQCWLGRGHHNCAVLEADRLTAALARRTAEVEALAPLARLGKAALEAWRDMMDFDGGDIQEKALTFGVIQSVTRTESCHPENCICAETDTFPLECFEDTPATVQARAALAAPEDR